jgi:hypothetical protein
MKPALFVACLFGVTAFAQTRVDTFPADSTPLTSAEQHLALVGKTYATEKFKDGSYWHVTFESNSRFTFYAFPGTWKDFGTIADGKSQICSDGKVMEVWCNEIQMKDGSLYLKSGKQGVVAMRLLP